MEFKISKNINRIDLHDSTIDKIDLISQNINLTFDWAKIKDFKEENLGTLILGKCNLNLIGIQRNKVEYEIDNVKYPLEFSKNLISQLDIITENESKNDNEIRISSLLKIDNKLVWTSWTTEFYDFEFTWNNYVTLEEWKSGKIPE